jgi:hypothetical protein
MLAAHEGDPAAAGKWLADVLAHLLDKGKKPPIKRISVCDTHRGESSKGEDFLSILLERRNAGKFKLKRGVSSETTLLYQVAKYLLHGRGGRSSMVFLRALVEALYPGQDDSPADFLLASCDADLSAKEAKEVKEAARAIRSGNGTNWFEFLKGVVAGRYPGQAVTASDFWLAGCDAGLSAKEVKEAARAIRSGNGTNWFEFLKGVVAGRYPGQAVTASDFWLAGCVVARWVWLGKKPVRMPSSPTTSASCSTPSPTMLLL